MLAVEDRLDATQLSIEQTEAQLKSLKETTVFSTLTVNLAEKGSSQASRIDPSDSFSGVLWDSLTLLGRGARIATLALTAALPFIVVLGTVALIVWYGWRRLRGRRNAENPSIPA
jgi:Flp pilus assembly protein TadB